MAIITLKQLLHRPAPGGPIDPNDPLPVRLYGPNGEPIGTQDDALKVTLTGSLGKSNFYVDRGENLVVPPGGTRVTVFEHVGPLVLDYLEFSTNAYNRIVLHIHTRIGGNWVAWRFGAPDASTVESWVMGVEILDDADGRWEVLHADVGAGTFKARFRETPVSFCEGLRVQLHNTAASTEYNGNVVMFGRLF